MVSFYMIAGLDQLTYMSDVIVEGKVIEVLPVKETVYTPESGTAEAAILAKTGAGMNSGTIRSYPVSIRVIGTLKGTVPQEIILYRSELTMDGEPVLKAGDTLIFFPADLTEGFKKYSGARLDAFKREIADYVKTKPATPAP